MMARPHLIPRRHAELVSVSYFLARPLTAGIKTLKQVQGDGVG